MLESKTYQYLTSLVRILEVWTEQVRGDVASVQEVTIT